MTGVLAEVFGSDVGGHAHRLGVAQLLLTLPVVAGMR